MLSRSRDGAASWKAMRLPYGIKLFAVIAIGAILALSFLVYFVVQTAAEHDIRNALFEQQRLRQVQYAKSVAHNIESDLDSLMNRLQTLEMSEPIQGKNFASASADGLLRQIYEEANEIAEVEGVYILDENDVLVNYFNSDIERPGLIGRDNSDHPAVAEYRTDLPDPTFSGAYTSLEDGTLKVALVRAIYDLDSGTHLGAVMMELDPQSFFARYGNVEDVNEQYLAALDRNGTILTSALKDIIGENVFGDYVQSTNTDKSSNDHYRRVMEGSESVAVFSFRTGERLNVGEPIILEGKPAYSIFVVTSTAAIYAQMEKVLANQKIELYLLLGGIAAAILVSLYFLIRWSNTLEKAVEERTQELQKANEQLQVNDKLQKEFINVAAHELRTPVQPLLGIADLLESQLDGRDKIEVSKDEIEMIIRNAKRLERLSSDILAVYRIESRSLRLNKEMVDLKEKIRNVIADSKSFMQNDRQVKIVFEPKTEKAAIVEADKSKLFEVISNLIRNAIKFTKEGTILITLEEKDGDALVTIKDTGTGIDPEILPRLFSKFATKSDQGTGLGLYLSKAIVEAHGGKIWAENNPDGKGATFAFTLSLAGKDVEK